MLDGTKKESTEPNLHVCGEDGTQRVVYKLKEKHAKGDRNKKKERKENLDKRRRAKREKRAVSVIKENDRCANFGPSVYARVSLFIRKKLT